MSSKPGATLVRAGVEAERLSVLVGTCKGCGSIDVFWDGRRLARVSLAGKPTRKLVRLAPFAAPRTGTVTIRVAGRRQVRIDGLVAEQE